MMQMKTPAEPFAAVDGITPPIVQWRVLHACFRAAGDLTIFRCGICEAGATGIYWRSLQNPFCVHPSWVSLRIPRAVPSILWDAYSVRGNFSTMSGKWQGIAMKETNCESSWIENLHSLFWQRRRIQFVGQGRMIWRPSRISV